MTKSFHSQICFNIYYQQNFYLNKNWTYLTIFNEKFPNHCKEEINSTVSSNILPLYKASSWIWQLSLCENNLESQIYLLVYKLNVCFIRLENLVYWNNLFIIYIVMLYMVFFIWAHKFSTIQWIVNFNTILYSSKAYFRITSVIV